MEGQTSEPIMDAVPSTEAEVDGLLASIESPGTEPQTQEQPLEPAAEEQLVTPEAEYKIKWNGEDKSVPLSKLISYAQQGYDYNHKMQDFNLQRRLLDTDRTSFEAKQQELEQKLNQYREVDDYVKQDPDWWNHVQTSWQQRGQTDQGQMPSQYIQAIDGLKQQLSELGNQVSTITEREKQVTQAKEDAELDQRISEYKTKYSDFDWNSTDETGLSLEQKILNHAVDKNVGDFITAANDFLFDEHLKRAQLKAKESVGEQVKKVTKLGLGPVTDKRQQQIAPAKNIRSRSYDELGDEALSELGLA